MGRPERGLPRAGRPPGFVHKYAKRDTTTRAPPKGYYALAGHACAITIDRIQSPANNYANCSPTAGGFTTDSQLSPERRVCQLRPTSRVPAL